MTHSTKHPPETGHAHCNIASTPTHFFSALLALCLSLTSGVTLANNAAASIVTSIQLETFQEPEVLPNVALEDPQPVPGSAAILLRTDNELTAVLATKGLPLGVYTFWWHLIHEDGELSILWAGNDIVSNRRGNSQLQTTLPEGEENAPGAIFLGHGLQPGAGKTVRVELWVRYHGAPSSDPEALAEQLTLPFGGCTDSRNTNPRPGEDYPCWNPQRALFELP
jgi:hypothetical protein